MVEVQKNKNPAALLTNNFPSDKIFSIRDARNNLKHEGFRRVLFPERTRVFGNDTIFRPLLAESAFPDRVSIHSPRILRMQVLR